MPTFHWTGKLSPLMMVVANLNVPIGWVTGGATDTEAMKRRIRLGYEGTATNDVTQYDKQAGDHYSKISSELLTDVDLNGKDVVDVGCGTGILSAEALTRGAAKVTCGDASEYMLSQCRKKLLDLGYGAERVVTQQLDVEAMPCADGSFDAVVSSMVLGLVPNQTKAVAEMARVTRKGGTLAIATHGPECWWEGADAAFRALPKRRILGYRVEYWPRRESEVGAMPTQAGLLDVRTRRVLWQHTFGSGRECYDAFAAASASWWLTGFPPGVVADAVRQTREYFQSTNVVCITFDIILAYAHKP
jgi:SAM-dependent methyltransferase